MCGIVGGTGQQGDWIEIATHTLRHRGPDRSRVMRRPEVQLGHARLAIIDRSEGADQPMVSGDGRLALVFNGELYNFQQRRSELQRCGEVFRTRSDTEVMLKLYERHGLACLDFVKGMFAFGLWDGGARTLLLARDRLGEKPLYFFVLPDGNILFASEIKALLRHPSVERRINLLALDDYLTYLYVPGRSTIFEGILKLQPGERLLWRASNVTIESYWTLPPVDSAARATPDILGQIQSRLDESVASTLVADVPVGIFLSGGLDSSAIVAAAASRTSRLKTFTVTFDSGASRYDERQAARAVANRFGTEHHELAVSGQSTELLPTIVRHFDQPFGNPTALLTYQISQETRKYVTVVIGGDGGDEVFAGYPRYRGIVWSEQFRRLPLVCRHAMATIGTILPESVTGQHGWRRLKEFLKGSAQPISEMYVGWVEYFDSIQKAALYTTAMREETAGHDSRDYLRSLFAREGPSTVDRAIRSDLQSFLPWNVLEYGDKMSMAHGLELRLPLLDADLVSLMARLPASEKINGSESKRVLRKVVANRLPPDVLARPKVGFNPPMGMWIDKQLTLLMDDYLGDRQVKMRGYFNPEAIRELRSLHARRRRDCSLHLWALLVLEEWHRAYVD